MARGGFLQEGGFVQRVVLSGGGFCPVPDILTYKCVSYVISAVINAEFKLFMPLMFLVLCFYLIAYLFQLRNY